MASGLFAAWITGGLEWTQDFQDAANAPQVRKEAMEEELRRQGPQDTQNQFPSFPIMLTKRLKKFCQSLPLTLPQCTLTQHFSGS